MDGKGVVHYSDRVPPNAGPEQSELSKTGRVVKTLEAPAAKIKREEQETGEPVVDPNASRSPLSSTSSACRNTRS